MIQIENALFLQRAFDYCNNLGGILPSFDFFDVVNIGERPRTSGNAGSNSTIEETEDEGTSVERTLESLINVPVRQLIFKKKCTRYALIRGRYAN